MVITISGTVPAQKNNKSVGKSKTTGKIFVSSSPRFKAWQKKAIQEVRSYGVIAPNPTAIFIKIWNEDKRGRDLDNQLSSILDLLKECEVITDDNCFVLPALGIQFIDIDKENPRAEITFYEVENV